MLFGTWGVSALRRKNEKTTENSGNGGLRRKPSRLLTAMASVRLQKLL
jgi:hypothetical protein